MRGKELLYIFIINIFKIVIEVIILKFIRLWKKL